MAIHFQISGFISCLLFLGTWETLLGQGEKPSPEAVEFFEKKIRPVLVENCFQCHSRARLTGNRGLRGNLSLESRASLLKGGDSGAAVVPGRPEKSLLLKAIGYEDPDLRMPPKGKLAAEQIADLTNWIQMGAPWPDDGKIQVAKEFNLKERSKHWSLQPLKTPSLPKINDKTWPKSPLDHFILARLEEKGLVPNPAADRRTLIRRATFDLIGLPPTPEEIDAFLTDPAPDAFTRVVDRLLESPHYGERWARHWLDLVRYAETYGHEFDFEIPEAYHYRDYLIRAFNADVPFNQFVMEHVAGDLLPKPRRHSVKPSPSGRGQSEGAFNESVIGTGFWWLGEAKHSPVDSRSDQADRIDNQLDVFGKTFLGMTIACARCHDHKFDAISTKDYYALMGYLQSSRQDRAFIDESAPREEKLEHVRQLRTALQKHLEPAKPALQARPSGGIFAHFAGDSWHDWKTTGEAFGNRPSRPGDLILHADPKDPIQAVLPGLAHSGLISLKLQGSLRSPTFTIRHKKIHYRLAGKQAKVNLILNGLQLIRDPIYGRLTFPINNPGLHWQTQDVSMWIGQRAYVEVLDEGPGYAAVEQIVFSDDPQPPQVPPSSASTAVAIAEGDKVKADSLLEAYRKAEAELLPTRRALATADGSAVDENVFLRGNAKILGEIVPRRFLEVFGGLENPAPEKGSGRLELARHMANPEKTPILPRVFVNRLWKHHFGEGIVRSVDDFGVLGQPPTHPELLDHLALELVKNGWSIKHLHRVMMLSSTYQMSSRPQEKGNEVDPENRLLHRMPVRRLEAEAIRDALLAISGRLDRTLYGPGVLPHLTPFMVGRGRPKASGPLDGNGRRSIYINVRRNFLTPMFLAFDYPTPFSTIGRRTVSNVPAQALTMLNNPLVQQQADLWAKNLLKENISSQDRIQKMFVQAYGRHPTQAELRDTLVFVEEQSRVHGPGNQEKAWTDLGHVLFNLKEFIFVP